MNGKTDDITGESSNLRDIFAVLQKVVLTDSTVLVVANPAKADKELLFCQNIDRNLISVRSERSVYTLEHFNIEKVQMLWQLREQVLAATRRGFWQKPSFLPECQL